MTFFIRVSSVASINSLEEASRLDRLVAQLDHENRALPPALAPFPAVDPESAFENLSDQEKNDDQVVPDRDNP